MIPSPSPQPFADVRLKGFGLVAAVAEVLALLDARCRPLPAEQVDARLSAGRVLAGPIVSTVNVPGFPRAAMDGYAVLATDTEPVRELPVVGESLPGRPFVGTWQPGQAIRIATGAPMPDGTDSVVMVEKTQPLGERVAIRERVIAGRNVGRVGEDVAAGSEVLPAGRVLRPQDVGLLAAISRTEVEVVRCPRVALLITGDELLPPGSRPEGCRIVDSNSPMLAALVARDGGEGQPVRYVPDRFEAVRATLAEAAEVADVVLVSGGTSVGPEDHAPRALAELGELAVHGVALRPARPLGLGFLPESGAIVFLLPGNPVACLCGYDLFAGRVVRRLGGRAWGWPYRSSTLALASEIPSSLGRVDYVRLRIAGGEAIPLATGMGSNLSSTVRADGFLLVPAEREKLETEEIVEVWSYG